MLLSKDIPFKFRFNDRTREFILQIGGDDTGGHLIKGKAQTDWGRYLLERVFAAGLSNRSGQALTLRAITHRDLLDCDRSLRSDADKLFDMIRSAAENESGADAGKHIAVTETLNCR